MSHEDGKAVRTKRPLTQRLAYLNVRLEMGIASGLHDKVKIWYRSEAAALREVLTALGLFDAEQLARFEARQREAMSGRRSSS